MYNHAFAFPELVAIPATKRGNGGVSTKLSGYQTTYQFIITIILLFKQHIRYYLACNLDRTYATGVLSLLRSRRPASYARLRHM